MKEYGGVRERAWPSTAAISSRALFDLDESNGIFERNGIEAYAKHQVENENNVLKPGVAFQMVKKLLGLNKDDVRKALDAGIATACILPHGNGQEVREDGQLRIAFDGNAVLFSDEAEKVFKSKGLEVFTKSEMRSANTPLPGGPFKEFLSILHEIQSLYPAANSPIRTDLITARSAPAHERVIKTLRSWNIRIDDALFLGGRDKSGYLKAFRVDIFFDDQLRHCDPASKVVPTDHPRGFQKLRIKT